jgi:glycosyltransferase involved in cell wall biosynthesis
MKDQPKISILMNCYNGDRFLKEALDSVYAQTYKNWEILFIDNCSTDNSAKIAKSYNDGRLKYYKTKTNLSLGSARNWGVKFINGKLLAFLDTDDMWFSDKLEKQLKIIEEDVAFVYGPVIQINENGDVIRETKINKRSDFKSLLERYDINMHSTLINLKIVNVKFNEKLSYCPDYELFMKIVSENKKFVSVKSSLAKYRISPNSLSNKTINIQMDEIRLVLNKLKKNKLLYKKYKKSFDICIYKFDHLYKAKKMLKLHHFYSASKEFYFLSKVSKKYIAASIFLVIPLFNKFFYNKFLFKYV